MPAEVKHTHAHMQRDKDSLTPTRFKDKGVGMHMGRPNSLMYTQLCKLGVHTINNRLFIEQKVQS